jgi:hypothetical protein
VGGLIRWLALQGVDDDRLDDLVIDLAGAAHPRLIE